MPISPDDAQRNLNQFIEKYGREGFLKLFLANYLQELVLLNIHSRPRKGNDDTSALFYLNYRGESYTASQVENFKKRLRKECASRAEEIVRAAKESGLLDKLTEDPSQTPGISEQLEAAFRSIIKEIE